MEPETWNLSGVQDVLEGIDGPIAPAHLVVKVSSRRTARGPGQAHAISAAELLAFPDENRVEVPVNGLVAGPVRDLDRLAVVPRETAPDHDPGGRGEDGFVEPRRDVQPLMEGAFTREGVQARPETRIDDAANRGDRR